MTDMGVAVYEILPNGCLSGVYCNLHKDSNDTVMNEIARKKSGDIKELKGVYTCAYIDYNGKVYECDLTIEAGPGSGHGPQYKLKWYHKADGIHFDGDGWHTRENQLTVHYSKV